jgi:hypothetical protein
LSKGVRFLSARASAAATADTGPRGEWRAHCALSTRIWTSKPSLASSRAPQPTSRSLGSEGGISAFSSDLSSLPTVHSAHCYVLWHTHSARQRGVRPATRRCDCCQSPSQAVRANCTPRCITSRHAAALPHLTFQNAKRKTKIQFSRVVTSSCLHACQGTGHVHWQHLVRGQLTQRFSIGRSHACVNSRCAASARVRLGVVTREERDKATNARNFHHLRHHALPCNPMPRHHNSTRLLTVYEHNVIVITVQTQCSVCVQVCACVCARART